MGQLDFQMRVASLSSAESELVVRAHRLLTERCVDRHAITALKGAALPSSVARQVADGEV